jgi:tyrosyl-DNA phosphodiesterase 2
MSDVVVSIQAKRFSSGSGKWNFTPQAPHDTSLPTSLSIITWNIDLARPEAARRLTAALDYLRYHAFPENKGGKPPHCLILLQEVNINAFNTLLAHPWVREWFKIVPASPEAGWPRGVNYGTITLVHAPLANSVCVHYDNSNMGRNALVTDIMMGGAAEHSAPRILRIINTHLESLPVGTPRRITQMGVIARLLKEDARILGGIACGDMNAIVPCDATLPEQNGLSDA